MKTISSLIALIVFSCSMSFAQSERGNNEASGNLPLTSFAGCHQGKISAYQVGKTDVLRCSCILWRITGFTLNINEQQYRSSDSKLTPEMKTALKQTATGQLIKFTHITAKNIETQKKCGLEDVILQIE
jgi:hypothetical protein